MQYTIHDLFELLKQLLILFAVISAIYYGYKIIKPPTVSWIQNKLGIAELYKGQTEIKESLNRGLEKLDSVLIQLTLNGGSVTIKDDLSIIKKRLSSISSELRSTIESSSTATFINDKGGSCIYANQALCDLFGASKKEDMQGDGWVNFIVQEYRERAYKHWHRQIQTANSISDTYDIIHGVTGKPLHIEYTVTITRDSKGEPITILGTAKETNEKEKVK